MLRRMLLAACLALSLSPALAQAPPAVPALPDTERRTSYSISSSTCACAVGFALYGDGTDYGNWLEVWLNGVLQPSSGYTITSPTGSLSSIPRPITDAVLTFNSPTTGTVQIVGARRPRRTTQFPENRGVAARDFNQALTDIISQNREIWDKTNDVTGRALMSQPGNTVGLLPLPVNCQSALLGFDASGLNPTCTTLANLGLTFVTSVSNSNGTLTIAPTTGNVIASLNPAHANTWSATQTFNSPAFVLGGDALGDSYYNSGTGNVLARLPIGSNGQCLTVISGVIGWGACTGTGGGAAAGSNTSIQFNTGGALGGNTAFLYSGSGGSGGVPTTTWKLTADTTARIAEGLDTNNTAYLAIGQGAANTYAVLFSDTIDANGNTYLGIAGKAQTPQGITGTNLFGGLNLYRIEDAIPGAVNFVRGNIGFQQGGFFIGNQTGGTRVGQGGGIIIAADQGKANTGGGFIGLQTSIPGSAPAATVTAVANTGAGGTAVFTATNGFYNGQAIVLTGASLGTLNNTTTYYACNVSAGQFQLSTSYAFCQSATYYVASGTFTSVVANPGGAPTGMNAGSRTDVDHHGLIPGMGVKFQANSGTLPTCSTGITPGVTYYVGGAATATYGSFFLTTGPLTGPIGGCAGFVAGVTYTVDTTIPNVLNNPITFQSSSGGQSSGGVSAYFENTWNIGPLQTGGPMIGALLNWIAAPANTPMFQLSLANLGPDNIATIDVSGRMTLSLASILTGCPPCVNSPAVTGAVRMITATGDPGSGTGNYNLITVNNSDASSFKAGFAITQPNGTNLWSMIAFNSGDTSTNNFGIANGAVNYVGINNNSVNVDGFVVLGWSSSDAITSAIDTGLSRSAAGVVQLGNGTFANTSGTLVAAQWGAGILYATGGLPLPACGGGNKGYRAAVSDHNAAPTFNATYAGGGTNFATVVCNGSNWVIM
jgi:hypothetical protein